MSIPPRAALGCVCAFCARMSVGLGGREKALWLLRRCPWKAVVFSVSARDLLDTSAGPCAMGLRSGTPHPTPPQPCPPPPHSTSSPAAAAAPGFSEGGGAWRVYFKP